MFEYRVTKYDPAHRDVNGAYRRDEWTSVCDIGRSFGGIELMTVVYQRFEDAYVEAALAFLRENETSVLTVAGLECHASPTPVAEGCALALPRIAEVIRCVLREEIWCRLDGPDAFVHIGHDFYMYIGVRRECPKAEQFVRRFGLFVEPFQSPYREPDVA